MPINTTSVTLLGAIAPAAVANVCSSCPLTTRKPDASPRCVTGMPASAGAAIALRDAGHHLAANACSAQRKRLLAASSEHERVAALQAHDAAASARGANHQRVDPVLRERMTSRALADEEPLRVPRVPQDPLVDERVIQDEIGRAQARDRLARQQRGIAGPRADERDLAPSAGLRAEGSGFDSSARSFASSCRPSGLPYNRLIASSSSGRRCVHRHALAPSSVAAGRGPRAATSRARGAAAARRAPGATAPSGRALRRSTKRPA